MSQEKIARLKNESHRATCAEYKKYDIIQPFAIRE